MRLIPKAMAAASIITIAAACTPIASADTNSAPPCASGDVIVAAAPSQQAATHRGVTLLFSLAPGSGACTLTGYPGVDSGNGGPLLHARRTVRGYMGGLPEGIDEPPTITLSSWAQARAVVEGDAVDAGGRQCPTYTDLRVTLPDTTQTIIVPAVIDACDLQIHPVTG